ncbi:hypothetical protein GCM10023205_82880 [Yinghuangia aomiensis]|uniref:Helicase XPB/Ssl2 N-terminal domain-containing protein n=1 Tax=Yinghuangia aomiensis TaxID=676205 RepID=A0ABP9IFU0_9ACTN
MTLSTTDSLAVYLASLPAPDLARVVTTAPTVPEEPRPRTLRHLAVCLADPETALLGCSFLSRGELQLLEVLWAVADERPPGGAARLGRDAGPRLDDDPVVVVDPDVVLALVGGPGTAEARELGPALDTLTGRVLAWPEDGRIRLHPGAASVFPLPLGLGAPAYPLLLGQRAEDLRTIVRELGGLPAGRKDDTVENAALAARLLGDPDVVRRVTSRLDPPARAALDELAEIGIRRDPSAAWGYYGTRPRPGDPLARLRRRGLLLATGDGWEMMPREVAMALRGDTYRVAFEARPPQVPTAVVDRDAVFRASAAAAAAAVDTATRLLHTCAVSPPQLLKSGGVGVRELRRLAKELACDEAAVRLWLHVAESAGLLAADADHGQAAPTTAYDAWLDGEPAVRLLALVRGWVTMPDVPMLDAAPASARRQVPPLSATGDHGGLALVARGALLRTLGGQDPGHAVADTAALARCIAWICPTPFRHGLEDIIDGPVFGLGAADADAADGGWPASAWGSGDATAPLPAETSAAERRIAVAVAGDAGDAVGPGGLGGLGDPGGPDGPAAHPGDGLPPTVPCDCPDCREVGEEIAHAFRGRFDAAAFTDATLREAAALGLVAHGALTALGGGVAVRHSAAVLLAAAEELLPPAARSARFRTDLTAVVAGPASVELARLLGGCADAEAHGPTGVWRFSEASVRRHLDAGGTAPGLLADLADIAVGGIPQRLHHLVHDVGCRYGQVRAAPAAAVVYSDDEALVAEIQRHSRLTALGLRRIAPTVLLSGQPLDRTVAALRRAGYAPAAETATGSALVERAEEFRVPGTDRAAGWPVALPMPEELSDGWRVWAADVLGRAAAPAPVLGAKAARLREAAPLLGPEDCAVLADALDRGSAVRVAATAYNGEPMTSTVAHLAMAGDSLYMRPPNGRPALLPFRLETLWMVLPADD